MLRSLLVEEFDDLQAAIILDCVENVVHFHIWPNLVECPNNETDIVGFQYVLDAVDVREHQQHGVMENDVIYDAPLCVFQSDFQRTRDPRTTDRRDHPPKRAKMTVRDDTLECFIEEVNAIHIEQNH